ncbi:hypothetical protein Tco_0600909 [Tanacetum coccineum]
MRKKTRNKTHKYGLGLEEIKEMKECLQEVRNTKANGRCEILYCSAAGDIMSKRSVPVSSLWVVADTMIASIFFYCFFAALVALLCSYRDSGEVRGAKGTGMKSVELALSMCDIVDINGFTVDPGYTEWSVYPLFLSD